MTLPDDAGPVLLGVARAAISGRLDHAPPAPPPPAAWLDAEGASFVTLTVNGRLRGCIGTLEPHRPLAEDVAANACAAAFRDRRFAPLRPEELGAARLHVSVLAPAVPLDAASRADALARLRPGVDGVVVRWNGRVATFLPQVWEQVPDPEAFLAHLWHKAGIPPGLWDDRVRLFVYTVASWADNGVERHDHDHEHDSPSGPLVAPHS